MSAGSSPHTRGARPPGLHCRCIVGIIPAYAGSTSRPSGGCDMDRDHPRIRGEHAALDVEGLAALGSSPHTRGALQSRMRAPRQPRIIPAYAGSTSGSSLKIPLRPGSSPHTRGARDTVSECERRHRIIPAYAGSTVIDFHMHSVHRDHPRIRGEHLHAVAGVAVLGGSSPHTRGARHLAFSFKVERGIIPAYAGSTSPWTASPR